MLKRFINWFTKSHEYHGTYVWAYYNHDEVTIIPTITITYGSIFYNGITLMWLNFGIWFHRAIY